MATGFVAGGRSRFPFVLRTTSLFQFCFEVSLLFRKRLQQQNVGMDLMNKKRCFLAHQPESPF